MEILFRKIARSREFVERLETWSWKEEFPTYLNKTNLSDLSA